MKVVIAIDSLKGSLALVQGLGFVFLSYLHDDLQPGIELVLDAVKLEECMKDADYVITGEGCLDGQTAMGKAPVGIAKLAKKYGETVIQKGTGHELYI